MLRTQVDFWRGLNTILMYRALCETLRHSRANDSARGRNWERMFLSLAQSFPRDKAVVFEWSNVAVCL